MFLFSPRAMRGSVVKIEMVPAGSRAVLIAPSMPIRQMPTVSSHLAFVKDLAHPMMKINRSEREPAVRR